MGASSQKSVRSIVNSKYSFSHPKSQNFQQISMWRYTEQDLEQSSPLEGEPLRWPFKLYNDQGYILTLIQNNSISPPNLPPNKDSSLPTTLRSSINMLEVLYSFCNRQIEEYHEVQITLNLDSKYSKENFSIWIYVYVGQNLGSVARLKLLREAMQLERYIARGGTSCVSKLFHDCLECTDISKELRVGDRKDQEYFASVSSLLEDKIKEGKSQKYVMEEISKEFGRYGLLKRTLLAEHQSADMLKMQALFVNNQKKLYPLVDCERIANNRPLIVAQSKPAQSLQTPRVQLKPEKGQVQHQRDELNDSSPFACQITEINFREKKKGNEESNIMDELSVLNEKKISTFVNISLPQEDYLVLTDYPSIRDFEQLSHLNVRLVVNLAANLCFNYYLNDLGYQAYYLTPLPTKPPAQAVLFETNIEHTIQGLTHSIISHTAGNRFQEGKSNHNNSRVAIHSAGAPFSDENVAAVVGYLIVRYLNSYEKAFEKMTSLYQKFKGQKSAKLWLNKIYVQQLLALEGRVLITSVINYGVSLNSSCWRGFQVSNNHCSPDQRLIARFIGQLSSPNQLTSLPNYSQHCYILLSNQLATSFGQLIEKWQKDQTVKAPQGIQGIKVLLGKDFPHKQVYTAFCKTVIPLMVKYELVNRSKCPSSFQNQFLYQLIQQTVAVNIQVEIIEKSFRKAQPFTPLFNGFEEQAPTVPTGKAVLPYNPKEKLTFKYPFLRPSWQPIQDDQHYFILQVTASGASVQIVKGKNWAGLEADKEGFFASLVEIYLENISEQKIWIAQEGEQSFLADFV